MSNNDYGDIEMEELPPRVSRRFNPSAIQLYNQGANQYNPKGAIIQNNLSGFSSPPIINKAMTFAKNNPMLSYAATAYLGSRFTGKGGPPDHAKLIAFVLIFLLVVLGISCGMYLTGAYTCSEHVYGDSAICSDQATQVYGDCAGVAQCLTCNGMKACNQ